MAVSVTISEKGGKPMVREFDQAEITIGRVEGNDIVLPKSNVSKRHARIVKNANAFVVIDAKSTNGTYINGKRINGPCDLRPGDKIFVGDFTIEVRGDDLNATNSRKANTATGHQPAPTKSLATKPAQEVSVGDDDVLPDAAWSGSDAAEDDWAGDWSGEAAPARREPTGNAASLRKTPLTRSGIDVELSSASERPTAAKPTTRGIATKVHPKDGLLERAKSGAKKPPTGPGEAQQEVSLALRVVHERLLSSMDLRRVDVQGMGDDELRARTSEAVREIVSAMEQEGELPASVDSAVLIDCVLNEALGLGPLEDLLQDNSVTEILVNHARQIYVERDGKLQATDYAFSSDQAVLGVIERIVAPLGRRIDESSPMVDARLKDGSRVNAIIPPLSIKGPTLTIRKFTREPLQIDDLVASETLSADMAEFLETCVRSRKNMLISGGTGSGKTTTLNVVSSFIAATERIITIEDAAELKLDQAHVVSLESRPPNIEGRGAVSIRDLVRNALRMRPDRIIIGECRGGEALDMLQAMNTGHDGSLTTVHANGPRDALARLETMTLMSGMELPIRAIREQIASAVDLVVQQSRFSDGSRRITHISEITGMEGDIISMHDLFVYDHQGFDGNGRVQGRFHATGFIPKFYEQLRNLGLDANLAIFRNT